MVLCMLEDCVFVLGYGAVKILLQYLVLGVLVWHRVTSSCVRTRTLRRIIGDNMYWLIFWHQYQCVLHISTRNKILWSHRIDFRRILPAIFCGKFHISSFVHLRTPLACCQSQHQQHWMFPPLLILRPFVLFPTIIPCSLWWWVVICVCLSVDLLSQSTINTRWVFAGD